MCRRIALLLLAGLFAYVTATVAAFVYLRWWQAILASAVTLGLIVLSAQLLIKTVFRRLGAMAAQADDVESDEFDRAEAAADLQNLRWYEVELTVFPDPAAGEPRDQWSPNALVLVPAGAKPPTLLAADEDESYSPHDLRVVSDG